MIDTKYKKSIMIRTDQFDRINNLKNDYKNEIGITLTTEDILIKGLEVAEQYLFDTKRTKIDLEDLNFIQKALIEDAIKKDIDLDKIKLLANKDFKITQMGLLLDVLETKIDMNKFRLLANPKLSLKQLGHLIKMETISPLELEEFEIMCEPDFGIEQFKIINKYHNQMEEFENKTEINNIFNSPKIVKMKQQFIDEIFKEYEKEKKEDK